TIKSFFLFGRSVQLAKPVLPSSWLPLTSMTILACHQLIELSFRSFVDCMSCRSQIQACLLLGSPARLMIDLVFPTTTPKRFQPMWLTESRVPMREDWLL